MFVSLALSAMRACVCECVLDRLCVHVLGASASNHTAAVDERRQANRAEDMVVERRSDSLHRSAWDTHSPVWVSPCPLCRTTDNPLSGAAHWKISRVQRALAATEPSTLEYDVVDDEAFEGFKVPLLRDTVSEPR
jgi:hypothetical protein